MNYCILFRDPGNYSFFILKKNLKGKIKQKNSFDYNSRLTDLALQYLYSFFFDVIHEEIAEFNSFAFRPFRSPYWVLEAVEFNLLTFTSFLSFPKFVFTLDVIRIFNSLNIEWVLNNISKITFFGVVLKMVPRIILRQWLIHEFFSIKNKDNSLFFNKIHLYNVSPISTIIENLVINNLRVYIKKDFISKFESSVYFPVHFNIEQIKNFLVIRYGRSMIFFVYNSEFLSFFLNCIVHFLVPRGLFLDLKTCYISRFSKESFYFLGFEFALILKRDNFLVQSFPSTRTVHILLDRLQIVFERMKNFESCFIRINEILKSWLNHYSFGNSNNIFRKLRFRLWHMTYIYFCDNYKRLPQFKLKKSYAKVLRRKLSFHIWSKHLKNFGNIKHWWNISSRDSSNSRNKVFDLFLEYPILYSTFSSQFHNYSSPILNAYHPKDHQFLSNKALFCKSRVFQKVLNLTKGCCGLCYWNLLFSEKDSCLTEVNKLSLVEYKSKFRLYNFKPLCLLCYKDVLRSLNNSDFEKILYYEQKKIFSLVSIS